MASDTLIERLQAGGIVHPKVTVAEAQRAGLRLAVACAMLEKETAGGHNVFGHDPTIFVGAGQVTKAKYQAYKQRRVSSGNKSMQGVGPCQLTWYEFQDEADREGGCWTTHPGAPPDGVERRHRSVASARSFARPPYAR